MEYKLRLDSGNYLKLDWQEDPDYNAGKLVLDVDLQALAEAIADHLQVDEVTAGTDTASVSVIGTFSKGLSTAIKKIARPNTSVKPVVKSTPKIKNPAPIAPITRVVTTPEATKKQGILSRLWQSLKRNGEN